ncbi:hypothetical protein ACQPX6_27145 [Actinomycetospora sp. CA-101289]|uniref:hypothetical protein n=1 Tax=Actinomycetospora sp. CA-101289 TaxID=3239893 RepID=UPI003D953F92
MSAHRAARRTRRTTAAALGGLSLLTLFGPGAGAALAAGADVHNCGDFRYQEDAQDVFDADTSDPNGLDDDGDDIACEARPHRPAHTELGLDDEATPSSSTSPSSSDAPVDTVVSSADRDCDDFSTQAEAQDALDADPSDPERLDADADDEACESFSYGDEVETEPAAVSSHGSDDDADDHATAATTTHASAEYPVGGVEAGDGSAPAGEAPYLLASGLLAATAVGGATVARHARTGGRHRRV